MPFRDCDKSDAKKIVLRNDFTHVQTVVEALHTMDRRTTAGLLYGDNAVAPEREIASDLRHEVRQVIGERGFIEISLAKKLACLHQPLSNDFLVAPSEYLREVLDSAM